MVLEVNLDNNIFVGKKMEDIFYLVVGRYTFLAVTSFSFQGTNNMHNDIKLRILIVNNSYFALKKLLK